jgi:ADP-ribose pyrophosphatase
VQPWQTLARETVYRSPSGKWLEVEAHTVELPNGEIIEHWEWVKTPEYVNIVAETEDGRFLCFRQTKYAAQGVVLGIPGGYIEPDEDPLLAAQRELREETGYHAAEWIALGEYVVDGNRGNGRAHFFLARKARWEQPVDADDLEEQELILLNRARLTEALLQGEHKVLPWAAAVAIALVKLAQL